MKHILKYWLPLYLYAGIIFYISSIPEPLPQISIPYSDKIVHVAEYIIFGILSARAFRNSSQVILSKNFIMLAVLTAIAYGALDEFHQFFVSFRICDIFDIIADFIGGVIGAFLYFPAASAG